MQNGGPLTVKSVPERLGPWLKNHSSASMIQQAEELLLRRDMVTLLSFVRDTKVVGTQSTGNMPLKAVREVTAKFVDPPKLEEKIGGHTYHLRSEEQLWPLYFLHILADVGGLLKTGRARCWRLTRQGHHFLALDPMLQVPVLLATWWYRTNWLIAFPVVGMGEGLPMFFQALTLASLRSLPVGCAVSFDQFSARLIEGSGLTWTAQESSFAPRALCSSIQRMVVIILRDFGALECKYGKEPLGKGFISTLVSFKITRWGRALLNALAISR